MLLERHAQLSAVVDAADGYNMDTQIKKILNGMAFPAPDYQKSVAVLSAASIPDFALPSCCCKSLIF